MVGGLLKLRAKGLASFNDKLQKALGSTLREIVTVQCATLEQFLNLVVKVHWLNFGISLFGTFTLELFWWRLQIFVSSWNFCFWPNRFSVKKLHFLTRHRKPPFWQKLHFDFLLRLKKYPEDILSTRCLMPIGAFWRSWKCTTMKVCKGWWKHLLFTPSGREF